MGPGGVSKTSLGTLEAVPSCDKAGCVMLDMSKAFDSIDRKKLMSYLREILTESELYIMNLLINDVVLNVVVGKEVGEEILTNIGSCQGDCLSAFFFILYLARAIKPIPKMIAREDYDRPLWSALDWVLNRDKNNRYTIGNRSEIF